MKKIIYLTLGFLVGLILFSIPQLLQQDNDVDTTETEQPILPENFSQVEQPPFEYKLPASLPFKVDESHADLMKNEQQSEYRFEVTYIAENNQHISFEVHGEVINKINLHNPNSVNGITYGYTATYDSRILRFQEGNLVYTIYAGANPNSMELNISEDELVEVAESITTVNNF